MRRRVFEQGRDYALDVLGRVHHVHLATTTPDGSPVIRALNAVIVDDYILFHGAQAGEKSETLGRAAVLTAEEVVANLPSYFVDPERACPATTLYDSAQAHGVIEEIEDVELKARMLAALMRKYQPEGGYKPISASDPLYERAVRGILVFGVRLDNVSGKAKLGQNRKPEELARVVLGLWQRGHSGDVRAIQRIFAANPNLERPARFLTREGLWLEPALDASALDDVVSLLDGQYWVRGAPLEELRQAHLGAQVWVGIRDDEGRVVGSARAITDGARHALLADVVVSASHRGQGLGRQLIEFALDHPALRSVRLIRLGTADQQRFYGHFGFVDVAELKLGFSATQMIRKRPEHSETPALPVRPE